MDFLLILGAISTGSLLSALVGLVGSRRKIGFGWAFLISVIFTPLIGIILTLLTDELPTGEKRWGCIAPFFILIGLAAVISIIWFIILTNAY